MLLATSGLRNIYDWWCLLLRGTATASAAPLLVGLLFFRGAATGRALIKVIRPLRRRRSRHCRMTFRPGRCS